MNLFTPKEQGQVAHLLSTIEATETAICIETNKQIGRHSWERTDARKRVRESLKAVRKQIADLLKTMDKSDKERLQI